MFEELTEPKPPFWKQLLLTIRGVHLTSTLAVTMVLGLACLSVPIYNCSLRHRLESDGRAAEGEVGSFDKSHIAGRSSTTYTWHYSFTANGRRWHGSWSDTVPYGPKPGDRVIITYLTTNPAINHHGSTGNQEIDGSDIELIVCALFLLGVAIYQATH